MNSWRQASIPTILAVVALLGFVAAQAVFPAPESRQEAPQEAPAEPERGNLRTLVEGCRKCHEDVCQEWEGTQHAKSWTDPVFQAQIAGLPDGGDSCARCHAPQEILITGFGKLPLARRNDRELGVNCVTCHMKGNTYHGPFDSKGHGGVDADEEYRKPALCLSCHGQPEARKEHDQGTSFQVSDAAKGGTSCGTCHMAQVQRKLVSAAHIKEKNTIGVQSCRVHWFTGARRNEIVKGCASLGLILEGGQAVVEITPNTGHCLPATSDRDVVLDVVFLGQDGSEVGKATRTWRFPDGPVLAGGKVETIALEAPSTAARARATLTQILPAVPGREKAEIQPINEAEASR